ncbi:MAG TPA: translation initiation factor IF-2 subunit beta [Euryarchaeota archaeon]|nr:MAG: translation initiation factor IF-2 subunit beta [Thermococci archaeon]RLF94965.1 MAG: translation initiation factor IF-2 subunit beta [Thermococci archaeon]HDI10634.1 translation initiation factor IF-2 subunit beta [Euryarchaeota archaeon]
MYDYHTLLKRARDSLPKSILEKKRFEMPRVVSTIEGNRTVIRNLKEISETLNRDEEHIMKYLLRELATAGGIEGGKGVLQGRFSNKFISDRIEKYVREFVLCPICKRPDTKIIREGRVYMLKCEACGAKSPLRHL